MRKNLRKMTKIAMVAIMTAAMVMVAPSAKALINGANGAEVALAEDSTPENGNGASGQNEEKETQKSTESNVETGGKSEDPTEDATEDATHPAVESVEEEDEEPAQTEDEKTDKEWSEATDSVVAAIEADIEASLESGDAVDVVKTISVPSPELPEKLLKAIEGKGDSVTLGLEYDNGTMALINGDNASNCTKLEINSQDAGELDGTRLAKLEDAGIDAKDAKSVRIKSDNEDFSKCVGVLIPCEGLEGHTVDMYYETATGYAKWASGQVYSNGYALAVIPQLNVNMVVVIG